LVTVAILLPECPVIMVFNTGNTNTADIRYLYTPSMIQVHLPIE
jgi:hypothetical protein